MTTTASPFEPAHSSSPPQPKTPDTPGTPGTEYVILNAWSEHRRITARSAHEALRHATEGADDGVYVAVPAGSFRPVRTVTETRTVTLLENA